MSTLPSLSLLGQLSAALFVLLAVAAVMGALLLLRRARRHATSKGVQPSGEPLSQGMARVHVVARVVAISESRMGRGMEREPASGLLRRPGLGYHPQRLERRIAVLR